MNKNVKKNLKTSFKSVLCCVDLVDPSISLSVYCLFLPSSVSCLLTILSFVCFYVFLCASLTILLWETVFDVIYF